MSSAAAAWTPYQAMRVLALVEAFKPETLLDASGGASNLSRLLRLAGVDAITAPSAERHQVVISLDTLDQLPESAVPGAIERLVGQCAETLVLTFSPWSDFPELRETQVTFRPRTWWREQVERAGLAVLEDLQGLPETLFPRHRTLVARRRPGARAVTPQPVALEGTGAEYLALAQAAGRAGNLLLAEESLRRAFAVGAQPGLETVCLFSANPWDSLFQRQHQLAVEFGRQQGQCLYIDPETLRVNVAAEAGRDARQHFLIILLRTLRSVSPGTFVLKFVRQMAFGGEPPRDVTTDFFDYLMDLVGGTRPLSVFYLPWQDELATALSSRTTVFYDCVDEFSGFSGVSANVGVQEQNLLAIADGVFVTAEPLLSSKGQAARSIYLVPNGVDSNAFAMPAVLPSELSTLPRPIVTFVGALADWIDLDLVVEAARLRPAWSFIMIGPTFTDVGRMATEPNIRLLGPRPYAALPGYLQASDVGLIPFRLNHLTLNSDPIKCYEYMAAGLAVLSTDLPQVRRFAAQDLVSIVASAEQLVASVESEMNLAPAGRAARLAARRDAAQLESWQRRAQAMLRIMRAHARLLAGDWAEAAALFTQASKDLDDPSRLDLDAGAAAAVAAVAAGGRDRADSGEGPATDSYRDELHLLGAEWFNRGRLAAAGRLFETIATGEPADTDAWFNLATVRVEEKHWSEALAALGHCAADLGASTDFLMLLGPVLANLGYLSAARRVLKLLRDQGFGLAGDPAAGLEVLSALSAEVPEALGWVEDLLRAVNA